MNDWNLFDFRAWSWKIIVKLHVSAHFNTIRIFNPPYHAFRPNFRLRIACTYTQNTSAQSLLWKVKSSRSKWRRVRAETCRWSVRNGVIRCFWHVSHRLPRTSFCLLLYNSLKMGLFKSIWDQPDWISWLHHYHWQLNHPFQTYIACKTKSEVSYLPAN